MRHIVGAGLKPALPRAVGPNVVPAQAGTQEGRRGRASRRSGAGRRGLLSLLPSREKARMRGKSHHPLLDLEQHLHAHPKLQLAAADRRRGCGRLPSPSRRTPRTPAAKGAPAAPSLMNVGSPRLTPARLAK